MSARINSIDNSTESKTSNTPQQYFRGTNIHAELWQLLFNGTITTTELVAASLYDSYVNITGEGCWASQERMAKQLGIHKRQMYNVTTRLLELEIIWKTGVKIISGRSYTIYETRWSRGRDKVQSIAVNEKTDAIDCTETAFPSAIDCTHSNTEEKERKSCRPASRGRLSPPKSPEKNGHANGNGKSSAHTNGHANGKEEKGTNGFAVLNKNGHAPKKKKGGTIPAHRMEQAKRFHRYIDKRDKSFTKINTPMWANVFGQIEEKFLGDIARVDALLDAFEQFGHLQEFPQFSNPSTLLKQTKWVEDAAKRLSGKSDQNVKKRYQDMLRDIFWDEPETEEFIAYCHAQGRMSPEENGFVARR